MLEPLNHIVFNNYPNLRYNSYLTNKCFDVEYGRKSSSYQPLMYVVNQCEEISPLMSMTAKVPKCILTCTNECVGVESPTTSVNQEELMHPHKTQQGKLPFRHENPMELIKL